MQPGSGISALGRWRPELSAEFQEYSIRRDVKDKSSRSTRHLTVTPGGTRQVLYLAFSDFPDGVLELGWNELFWAFTDQLGLYYVGSKVKHLLFS